MKRSGGTVLVLALWTLFFLSALAVAIYGHVASNIQVAKFHENQGRAYALARAGVALAVAEGIAHLERYADPTPTNAADTVRREMLFMNNAGLAGGVFSVTYLTARLEGDSRVGVVTNYGLLRETAKVIDLDSLAAGGMAWTVVVAVAGMRVAESITNYPDVLQKKIATDTPKTYGKYSAVQELLAIDGLTYEAYRVLEQLATLNRYKFRDVQGRKMLRDSFGATAEGVVTGPENQGAVASRRITFVYDSGSTNFLYWREY